MIFTDESHFYWGPSGKLWIVRKEGERYYPEHVQYRPRKPEKDEKRKRFHLWAAVGYNFISPLVFYEPTNTNGKMSQEVYINQILEPYVSKWLADGLDFTMEEDNDSGYGTMNPKSPAAIWKKNHRLKWYGNAPYSPDLAIIEACWSAPKHHVKKLPHYGDETTKELILEG